MHLPVDARNIPVLLQDDGGVMIESGSPALEEGGDNDHAMFLGEFSEESSRRTGNRLGKVEVVDILHLAEIKSVMQFLQYDEFRTRLRKVGDLHGKS